MGPESHPTPEYISAGLDQAEAYVNDPNRETNVGPEADEPTPEAKERNLVGGIRRRLETAAARLDQITSEQVEGALKATVVALPAFGPEALAFEPFVAAALAGVSRYNDRKANAPQPGATA
jgi:hypothetical protein